ncbi:hypothetical protein MKW92_021501 [Papaver armeniacum]|nr:hypothetical protein MKW92_021501 [Papaver armeniacum]
MGGMLVLTRNRQGSVGTLVNPIFSGITITFNSIHLYLSLSLLMNIVLFDITHINPSEHHSLYKNLGITTKHEQIYSITGITNNTAISNIGRQVHRALCLGEWVFSCITMFQLPGIINFYLSFDGTTPISQILKFDFL